jgi:hypothetical protein
MTNAAFDQERLGETIEVLTELSGRFMDIPGAKAAEAAACLTRASNYVVELLFHLANGDEPHDAVRSTARGEMKIGQREQKE